LIYYINIIGNYYIVVWGFFSYASLIIFISIFFSFGPRSRSVSAAVYIGEHILFFPLPIPRYIKTCTLSDSRRTLFIDRTWSSRQYIVIFIFTVGLFLLSSYYVSRSVTTPALDDFERIRKISSISRWKNSYINLGIYLYTRQTALRHNTVHLHLRLIRVFSHRLVFPFCYYLYNYLYVIFGYQREMIIV